MGRRRCLAPRLGAAVFASGLLLVGCSSDIECKGCGPTVTSPISVSAELNGHPATTILTVGPGTDVDLDLTMHISDGAVVSSIQVGVLNGRGSGYSARGPCGVEMWIYQVHKSLTAGTYHFATHFRVEAFPGVDQPMSLAAYVTTGSDVEDPVVATYRIAPVDDSKFVRPLATPPCG